MYNDPKLENGPVVLVVEDDLFFQMLIKRIFSTQNINSIYAENGAQAIIRLNTTPGITHILLDVNMPTMDGYSLLEYIRSQQSLDHIHIFMCSAHPEKHFMDGAAKKSIDLGNIKKYFEKPVDFNQLVSSFAVSK